MEHVVLCHVRCFRPVPGPRGCFSAVRYLAVVLKQKMDILHNCSEGFRRTSIIDILVERAMRGINQNLSSLDHDLYI